MEIDDFPVGVIAEGNIIRRDRSSIDDQSLEAVIRANVEGAWGEERQRDRELDLDILAGTREGEGQLPLDPRTTIDRIPQGAKDGLRKTLEPPEDGEQGGAEQRRREDAIEDLHGEGLYRGIHLLGEHTHNSRGEDDEKMV